MDCGFYSFLALMAAIYIIITVKEWIEDQSYHYWKEVDPEFQNSNNLNVVKTPLQDPRIRVAALRK